MLQRVILETYLEATLSKLLQQQTVVSHGIPPSVYAIL